MKRKSTKAYKDKVGYVCMNCGRPGNIAHHIVLLSKGGLDHPDNWMVLCKECQDKEQVHKYADELELELATKKHYFESGQEIEKPPLAFIIGPQRTINLMHSRIRNQTPKSETKEIKASTRLLLSATSIKDQKRNKARAKLDRDLLEFCLLYLDLRGYEVKKKGE